MCSVWKTYSNSLMQIKDDMGDNENIYKFCESDIENMNWMDVVVHNDTIYERKMENVE